MLILLALIIAAIAVRRLIAPRLAVIRAIGAGQCGDTECACFDTYLVEQAKRASFGATPRPLVEQFHGGEVGRG